MPRDKWGIHKKPYISWLGSHHRSRTKVSNKNAIRLDERRSNKQLQQNIEEKDDIDQLTKIIPRLQLETMAALVLVLVQDSSVALNLPRGPISQNRLAPPTPNVQKSTGGYLSKNNSKNTFCDQIWYCTFLFTCFLRKTLKLFVPFVTARIILNQENYGKNYSESWPLSITIKTVIF